ncbi:MAG: hypothetical protein ABF379_03070 [Akkermansiaceae bacterium]
MASATTIDGGVSNGLPNPTSEVDSVILNPVTGATKNYTLSVTTGGTVTTEEVTVEVKINPTFQSAPYPPTCGSPAPTFRNLPARKIPSSQTAVSRLSFPYWLVTSSTRKKSFEAAE